MNPRSTLEEPAATGPLQWLLLGIVLIVAAATGVGLLRMMEEPAVQARPVVLAQPHGPIALPLPLPALRQQVAVADAAPPPAAACPMQRLDLALPPAAPLAVCVDPTRVLQNGSVRSYRVQASGNAPWALRIDVAGGAVVRVTLSATDGRRYACAAQGCSGLSLGRHDARGVRTIGLASLQLVAAGSAKGVAPAIVSGRLEAPADAQVPGLACTGPTVTIGAADGSAYPFCGQGGAGVEFAEDGLRYYRFQDHEGQTLSVALNADERITRIEYGAFACAGSACTGASTSSPGRARSDPADARHEAAPPRDLAERSFFFGRTALFDNAGTGRPPLRPGLVLDGSLVMPAQE